MARPKTLYSCTECGASSPKWQGQCPGCGVWNTLVETVAEPAAVSSRFVSLAGEGGAQLHGFPQRPVMFRDHE